MAKYCNRCGKRMPDNNFSFCPYCASDDLIEKDERSAGFQLNMGDANAIEGGVHISDSHTIDSHNVHNETHNTWITKQERQKSSEEVREEKEKVFREIVRDAFEDGRITDDERRVIIAKISELNIDRDVARKIVDQEQTLARRRVKDRSLKDEEYALVKAVIESIKANDRDGLFELVDDLKLLNARIDNGEVQFFYYMLLASLMPGEFISLAESDKLSVDCFWKTVWLSMATHLVGNKRSVMLDYKFHEYIDAAENQFPGNVELAICMDNIKESCNSKTKFKSDMLIELSKAKYKVFASDHQSFLMDLGNAVGAILSGQPYPEESRFYMESFFQEYVMRMAGIMKEKQDEESIFAPLKEIPEMLKIPTIAE